MLTLCYIFNKIPLNSHSEHVTAGSSGVMFLKCIYYLICQSCSSLHPEKQLLLCKMAGIGRACQCKSVTR